jgi:hypothetical protein
MEKGINKQLSFGETSVEDLVRADHPYRKILKLVDFEGLIPFLIPNCTNNRPNIFARMYGLSLNLYHFS